MKNAIEIKKLNLDYDNPFVERESFALKDVNLEIKEGTIVGLIGKNGAGKTTLINLILNIIKAKSGTIEVLGKDNKAEDFYKVKENIGVVLDRLGIYDSFSIEDVDKLMGYAYKNWSSQYFKSLLEKLDLYTDKKIKEFSTGMKKKLALAVALGHQPDLLILDEPTANLDPFARDEIIDFIYDYTRDESKTVLISSHIISDLEKICDYIIYLDNGQVRFYEEKDALMDKYAIIKVSKEEYQNLDKSIIIFEEDNKYGYELLVKGDKIPNGIRREFSSLDEIVIRLIKANLV